MTNEDIEKAAKEWLIETMVATEAATGQRHEEWMMDFLEIYFKRTFTAGAHFYRDEMANGVNHEFDDWFDEQGKWFTNTSREQEKIIARSAWQARRENLIARIAELEAELAKEMAVTDFYANGNNWFYPGDDYSSFLVAQTDMSRTQRGTKRGGSEDIVCGGKLARARQKERLNAPQTKSEKN